MSIDARQARRGEELDVEKLTEFLTRHFDGVVDNVQILQFPAGSSNLTYLIGFGGAEYILRRPPFGNTVKSAHDMGREFKVLSKLSIVYPPAPKPILFCDDELVVGSEFYLMERRSGLIIRGKVPAAEARTSIRAKYRIKSARTLETSHDLRLNVCKNFVQNLADLHALDYEAAGLGDLGKPDGYVQRQVHGWTKRYFAAKTDEWPELEYAISWLNENIPADSGASLVHNDYKFDNVMLDPSDLTKIIAVLDWEMVTIGDPLMDLGTTLGYWMSRDAGDEMLNMPFNPRVLMENISRHDLTEMYAEASGRDISNILYYYVFGTFKIAVICQQIYWRFVRGVTTDARFANFDKFVGTLGKLAWRAVENKSI